jgi:SAM-dependent methyltransferase
VPFSSQAGKDWIKAKVEAHRGEIAEVLDVGAGSGTYAKLLRNSVLPDSHFTAIEVWEPYVEKFRLGDLYDAVLVGNALAVEVPDSVFDLAIFGDVLEHVTEADAIWMVERFEWRYAVLSLPVTEYPQGEYMGNPHEAHVATWSAQDVRNVWGDLITDERLYGGDGGLGEVEEAIGVFWLERKAGNRLDSEPSHPGGRFITPQWDPKNG